MLNKFENKILIVPSCWFQQSIKNYFLPKKKKNSKVVIIYFIREVDYQGDFDNSCII